MTSLRGQKNATTGVEYHLNFKFSFRLQLHKREEILKAEKKMIEVSQWSKLRTQHSLKEVFSIRPRCENSRV